MQLNLNLDTEIGINPYTLPTLESRRISLAIVLDKTTMRFLSAKTWWQCKDMLKGTRLMYPLLQDAGLSIIRYSF
jgi:hypothetical protein